MNRVPETRLDYRGIDKRWIGRLSGAVAVAVRDLEDGPVRRELQRHLDEFLRNGPASEELRDVLREVIA